MKVASPHDAGRYDAVARALHWTIAVLLIGNIAGGLANDALEGVVNVIPAHKAVGITVLALSMVRLAWRLAHRPPPLPAATPAWERATAHLVHALFYALMIGLPLSGWIFASAGRYPLSWFGLFDIPKFALTRDDPIVGLAREGHEVMGYVAIALIVLHIGAALRHQLLLRDGVLQRML